MATGRAHAEREQILAQLEQGPAATTKHKSSTGKGRETMETSLLELIRSACEIHGEDESSILTNATPMQLLQEFDDEDPNVVSDGQIEVWGSNSVFALDYTKDRGNYLIH